MVLVWQSGYSTALETCKSEFESNRVNYVYVLFSEQLMVWICVAGATIGLTKLNDWLTDTLADWITDIGTYPIVNEFPNLFVLPFLNVSFLFSNVWKVEIAPYKTYITFSYLFRKQISIIRWLELSTIHHTNSVKGQIFIFSNY